MSSLNPTATRSAEAGSDDHRAGPGQGLTLSIAGFFPVMSILSLAPALPAILGHFRLMRDAATFVPTIITLHALMVALLSPVAGWTADRYGRRNLCVASTFFYAVFGVLPFLFESVPALVFSRLGLGACEACILVTVNALISDYFPVGHRRGWLTAQGVIAPALGIASIGLSGWLTSIWWNGAFLIYLSGFVICVCCAVWCYEPARATAPPVGGRPRARTRFPVSTAAVYAGATLIASVVYYVYTIQSGLALSAAGIASPTRIGLLLVVASLGSPLGALLFFVVSRRVPAETVNALFMLIMGVGTLGVGVLHSLPLMVASGFVQQVGAGMAVTALLFWVSRLLAPEHRGLGYGIWNFAFFIGQVASPVVVGVANRELGGILPAFSLLGLLGMASAVGFLVLRIKPEPELAAAELSRSVH